MLNKEVKHIDITNTPELLHLAEEVQKANQVTMLTKDGEELVKVTPAKPTRKKRAKGGPTTMDDPMWNLVGTGHSGVGDISANTDKYLADAYLNRNHTSNS